jgi:hypothetical protein
VQNLYFLQSLLSNQIYKIDPLYFVIQVHYTRLTATNATDWLS